MEFWIVLWKFCFIASLLAFAGLAIIVTVGGALDIRRLILGLQQKHDDGDTRP